MPSALEGHVLAHKFFESKVQRLHEFLSSHIEERIAEGVFRPVNPLLAARGFVGMIVHYILLRDLWAQTTGWLLPGTGRETFVTLFCEGIKQ